MASAKRMDVTVAQGQEVRRLANSKGLSREQFQSALNSGRFATFLDGLKVRSLPAPVFDPKTGLYTFPVDFGKSIGKAVEVGDPTRLVCITSLATDANFPDARTGLWLITARIWKPGDNMTQEALEAGHGGDHLMRPKEGIAFCQAFPRPALDGNVPLAFAGQFPPGAVDRRCALYASLRGAKRFLDFVWLRPFEEWGAYWSFPVVLASQRLDD